MKRENEDTEKLVAIKKLIDKGKKEKNLTYEEITDHLEKIDLDPDEIDEIFQYLDNKIGRAHV